MTASATSVETKQRPWWMTLLIGIIATLIGAVLLWSPAKTTAETWRLLVGVLGIYWVITGILDLVHMFTDRTAWGWKLFIGVISIIAGMYILAYPTVSAVALPRIMVFILGLWGLIYGIIWLVMAFRGGGWGVGILGVLGIIFGIALMGNYMLPGMGLAMLWVIAVTAFVGGIIMIIQAFRQRSA